ncbi:unnamed protein product [Lactuca virosa]|uniref:Uncharacterized protein n=1 Tax=Lactuca virosa TaxID=75947 RepID=A0AAU9PAR6_9ASTR|nr:unnamed protein product [Lactuca virosa]
MLPPPLQTSMEVLEPILFSFLISDLKDLDDNTPNRTVAILFQSELFDRKIESSLLRSFFIVAPIDSDSSVISGESDNMMTTITHHLNTSASEQCNGYWIQLTKGAGSFIYWIVTECGMYQLARTWWNFC